MDNKNNSSLDTSTLVKIATFVAFIVVAGLLLTELMPTLFPPQASAESVNVDELFRILLVLGGIVFFLIQGLLVISVIAFRARPGDSSDGPASHGNMTLEIVWTIIPSLVVVFLAIMSFNVWNQNTAPKDNINMVNGDSVGINVTGQQYAWSHSYHTNVPDPNNDGENVVLNTGTVLHTYIGQNVEITMQTQDVIHSYWIPAMRVKQDLLPGNPDEGGRPTQIRFTPRLIENETYPAEYPIVCAELCGDGHGRMRGTVVVHENEEQFLELFFEPEVDKVLNPPADPVLRAPGVLQGYACNGCHVLDELGWAGLTGPSLNGIADRAGERAQRAGNQSAEEYLVTSLWNSGAYLAPGYQNLMPVFGPDAPGANEMSAEELYSIVAFLCTQGDDSDCDNENNTVVIPEAINNIFGVEVDVDFGQSGDGASAESTAEPDSEATEEPDSEMTEEPDSEATEEASDSD